jgi:hypothetical protein
VRSDGYRSVKSVVLEILVSQRDFLLYGRIVVIARLTSNNFFPLWFKERKDHFCYIHHNDVLSENGSGGNSSTNGHVVTVHTFIENF